MNKKEEDELKKKFFSIYSDLDYEQQDLLFGGEW